MSLNHFGGICYDHPDKELILVCTTCDGSYICVKCITTTHLYHNCIEIDEYLESVKDQRHERHEHYHQQRLERTEEFTLTSIQKENADLTQDNSITNVEESIIERDKIKEAFDEDIILRLTKDQLMHTTEPLPSLADEIAGIDMLDSTRNFDSPKKVTDSKCENTLQVHPEDMENDSVTLNCEIEEDEEIHINLQTENENGKCCMMQALKVIVDTSYVRSVCCSDEQGIWFACCDMRMKRLTSDRDIVQITNIDSAILDITRSPVDNAVWMCCSDGTVRRMKNEELPEIRFCTESIPLSLGRLPNGDVVCGLKSGNVIRYNENGCEVCVLDTDTTTCTEPYKISVCHKTNNIAVADRSGDSVIILDDKLRLKFLHNGSLDHSRHVDDRTIFCPCDICYDSKGDLLVADYGGRSVILIDGQTGKFIKNLTIDEISSPTSVAISRTGSLWVGYETGKIELYETTY